METALIVQPDTALVSLTAARAQTYLDSARARNTIRGYRSSFGQFGAWCVAAGLPSMPAAPETIALYLGAQAGRLKTATLQHHLAAIAKAHKSAGFASPVKDNQLIAETLKGIKRTHGSAIRQMAPVMTEDLRMMLRTLPENLLGVRDRALLLVGFSGTFRRSELVSLDVADLSFTSEGLLITLRRSKTDQDGEGRPVPFLTARMSRRVRCAQRRPGWGDRASRKALCFVPSIVTASLRRLGSATKLSLSL